MSIVHHYEEDALYFCFSSIAILDERAHLHHYEEDALYFCFDSSALLYERAHLRTSPLRAAPAWACALAALVESWRCASLERAAARRRQRLAPRCRARAASCVNVLDAR